eukprot:scaffold480_cov257-Pinguiococcus_pyrenoidosus.AAC.13
MELIEWNRTEVNSRRKRGEAGKTGFGDLERERTRERSVGKGGQLEIRVPANSELGPFLCPLSMATYLGTLVGSQHHHTRVSKSGYQGTWGLEAVVQQYAPLEATSGAVRGWRNVPEGRKYCGGGLAQVGDLGWGTTEAGNFILVASGDSLEEFESRDWGKNTTTDGFWCVAVDDSGSCSGLGAFGTLSPARCTLSRTSDTSTARALPHAHCGLLLLAVWGVALAGKIARALRPCPFCPSVQIGPLRNSAREARRRRAALRTASEQSASAPDAANLVEIGLQLRITSPARLSGQSSSTGSSGIDSQRSPEAVAQLCQHMATCNIGSDRLCSSADVAALSFGRTAWTQSLAPRDAEQTERRTAICAERNVVGTFRESARSLQPAACRR